MTPKQTTRNDAAHSAEMARIATDEWESARWHWPRAPADVIGELVILRTKRRIQYPTSPFRIRATVMEVGQTFDKAYALGEHSIK